MRPKQWMKNLLVASVPLAAGRLFEQKIVWQIGFAFIVLGTALAWWGRNRLERARVGLAAVALLMALSGSSVENCVENLRAQRHDATEAYLISVRNAPVVDSQQKREELRQVRARFGAWHGLSVGLNLGVLVLVAGLVVMAVPGVRVRPSKEVAD